MVKIFITILLKINNEVSGSFKVNENLIFKYFNQFKDKDQAKYLDFERYLNDFYKFCFELSLENMIRDAIKFKDYGCT